MRAAPVPPNEEERIATLRRLLILDTKPEDLLDGVTAYATKTFDVPICLISLVDSDRQWFKSNSGLPNATETSREVSFCGHAILQDEIFEVTDALVDPAFSDNPLVTGEPYVRFYAGHPLKMQNGHNVGTLCLLDRRPRKLSASERIQLAELAKVVASELQGKPYTLFCLKSELC
jgi:GAF domain-containing protein